MHALKLAIGGAWIVFWIYWLASASVSKQSVPGGWRTRLTGVSVVGVFVISGVLRGSGLAVHSVILAAIGAVLFACGIALAVWARRHLGRNWGMPMTQRAEPELVTSGPYRFVRHPIYSGLLVAMLGTALVDNLLGLIVVAVLVAYFYCCGTVEERNLTATFLAQPPLQVAAQRSVRGQRAAVQRPRDERPDPGPGITSSCGGWRAAVSRERIRNDRPSAS